MVHGLIGVITLTCELFNPHVSINIENNCYEIGYSWDIMSTTYSGNGGLTDATSTRYNSLVLLTEDTMLNRTNYLVITT